MLMESNLFGETQPVPSHIVMPPQVECTAGWNCYLPEEEEVNRKRPWLVIASGSIDKAELTHAYKSEDEKEQWVDLEVKSWLVVRNPPGQASFNEKRIEVPHGKKVIARVHVEQLEIDDDFDPYENESE